MADPVYTIGIDLGTTNSVVAYTETNVEKGKKPDIRIFEIPQLVEAGTIEKRKVLPSFILLPGEHDVPQDALKLPWDPENRIAIGEFARERGTEIPHRLIASSKSWLCHTLVDRNKPILPWGADEEEVRKLSPVEVSSLILKHIRNAWNHTMALEDDNLRIENQDVLLTVPASFDAVARELTVKAADMAGLSNITLLEEPQAAFYAWIESSGEDWREKVVKDDMVLVCDVGGGTSDFSLIKVSEEEGDLTLDRVAVGDHLLVGGDNMDLALAYAASQQLPKRRKLDNWQMKGLWHACRKAKETLLSDPETHDYTVTILGRGSKLIGGTQKTTLSQNLVRQVVLDGFFPECPPTSAPLVKERSGIHELGLTYEADPAITRHLAYFLNRKKGESAAEGDFFIPTAVLFNGGVMKAEMVRNHIMSILGSWAGPEGAEKVREIETHDYDLTVARGAAFYGLTRMTGGVRIRGGLNRSYYVGVAAAMPAVPGMPAPIKALCVAPFGLEEGDSAALPNREFVLVVGEPVKFDFLGSTVRLNDSMGTVVEDWEEEIEEITTIETTLDGEPGTSVPVFLEVKVTEIGTLELWCVSKADSSQRWKLEFNVREQTAGEAA